MFDHQNVTICVIYYLFRHLHLQIEFKMLDTHFDTNHSFIQEIKMVCIVQNGAIKDEEQSCRYDIGIFNDIGTLIDIDIPVMLTRIHSR